MADTQNRMSEPRQESTHKRPRWLIGAAAALILLVAGGTIWAITSTDNSDEDITTPGPMGEVEPEIAAVLSAIDSYNAGDREAWAAAQATGELGDVDAIMMNANNQLEVDESSCRIAATRTAEIVVSCDITARDDFYGAGGITDSATFEYTLNDELKIIDLSDHLYEDESGECCPELSAFNTAFHNWLRTEYPEVHDEIGNSSSIPGFGRDPDHMLTALDYVGQFVAQADGHPLDPSSP